MARYRTKDEIDLAWNKTRRQITRDIDTRIMNIREEIVNTALGAAWDKFTKAMESGDVVALEDEMAAWVDSVVDRKLRPVLEAAGGDVDEG